MIKTLNDSGVMDNNVPPYYPRMTMHADKELAKLNKKKEELERLMFEEGKICPMLMPRRGKMS